MTITMYVCTQEDTVMSFITASSDTFLRQPVCLPSNCVVRVNKDVALDWVGFFYVMRKIFIKEHHLITIKARYLEHQSIF